MSTILRHKAAQLGLPITPDGWIEIGAFHRALEAAWKGRVSADTVKSLIRYSDKLRFQFLAARESSGDEVKYIRCTQGHSLKTITSASFLLADRKIEIMRDNLPECLTHGTHWAALLPIMIRGLLPGGGKTDRIHNHFSPFALGDPRNVAGARFHAP